MHHEVFSEWCVDMLQELKEGYVIVMNNARYHSTLKEKLPTTETSKADIVWAGL